MPTGKFPFRRTFEFLNSGKLILKSDVKNVLLNYTTKQESLGLRNFIYKDVPQIQYKNRTVQITTTRNRLTYPVVHVFFGRYWKLYDIILSQLHKQLRQEFTVTQLLLRSDFFVFQIFSSSYYSFPCKLCVRICCEVKRTTSALKGWMFSLNVCWMMYGHDS